jgi:hypothetical protein
MRKLMVVAAVAACSIISANADTITYTFINNIGADFSSYVDGASSPIVINDIAATANGEAFTFDLTVTGILFDDSVGFDFNSQRVHFDSDARQKSVTFSIDDIQGNVEFRGFTTVDRYAFTTPRTWDINGQNITTGSDDALALTAPITGSMTITGLTTDATRLEGFQIEVIPEPATLGMVALFGGGILFIRKRMMI